MAILSKRWNEPRSLFGDVVVIAFVLAQCMDGVFTYLGIGIWGPRIEINPLISTAMSTASVAAAASAARRSPSASASSCTTSSAGSTMSSPS